MTDLAARLTAALVERYKLERELGKGGMAVVYCARDLRHGRMVAVKVVKPELSAVLGPERFLAEIRVTAHLRHPHILPLFDSGSADGLLFYVMPYIEGESLRDKLRRERQLPIDDAVRIAREVASALDYAHRHGVIHRQYETAVPHANYDVDSSGRRFVMVRHRGASEIILVQNWAAQLDRERAHR